MSSIHFDATLDTGKLESSINQSKKTVREWSKDIEKSSQGMDRAFTKTSGNVKEAVTQQKALIKELEADLKKLEKAYKDTAPGKESQIANKKLAETRSYLAQEQQRLINLQNEQIEVNKREEDSANSLTSVIGKWALTLGGATAALGILKKAFQETTQGLNAFNLVGAITKQLLNDIVSGAGLSMARLMEAADIQREFNRLRQEEYVESYKVAKLNNEYQQLYSESLDQTLEGTEKLKIIDAALAAHNKAIDIQQAHIREALSLTARSIENAWSNEKFKAEYAKLMKELEDLEAQRVSSTKRLTRQRSQIVKDGIDEELEWRKNLHENLQKLLNEYLESEQKQAEKLKELDNQIALNKLKGKDKELLALEQKYKADIQAYSDNEAIKTALAEKYAQDRFEVEMKYLDKIKDENRKISDALLKLDPGKGYSLLRKSLTKGKSPLISTNQSEESIAKKRELNLEKEKETRQEILAGAIQFTGELAGQLNLTQEQEEAVSSLLSITSQLAQGNFIGAAFSILSKVLSVFGQMGAVMREPEWKKQIEAWDDLIERQQRVIELSERTGGTEKALKDAVTLAQKELADINAAIMRERERRGTVPEDLLDARREAMNNLQDAQQALTEFLAGGVNQIDIAGIIAQGFEDGKKSAKDFTDDFNELMRQAINNSLEQLSKPSITAWYQKFAADMESAGGLDDQEIIKLKEEWNAIVVAEKARRDQAYAIAGITDRAVQNEGLTGQIRREITEETGTELAGLFRRFADDQRVAKDYSIQGVNHLVGIEANTAETVNQLQLAITELQAINTNTKQVAVGAL